VTDFNLWAFVILFYSSALIVLVGLGAWCCKIITRKLWYDGDGNLWSFTACFYAW